MSQVSQTTRVKDLLELPKQVKKSDYVQSLTDGLAHEQRTVDTYVVTPKLALAFDQALGLVSGALADKRSAASYLHGSFGSGKSHFMAILSLLLHNNGYAWNKPELHGLREKYGFVAKSKVLELPMHMIGASSIEEKVFGAYVAHVRAHHPEAALPGLFADEQLFQDARALLKRMGDDKFFEPMQRKRRLGQGAAGWDPATFEAAASSDEPAERAKLFDALTKAHFSAYAGDHARFIELDRGLSVMSKHAAGLGYGVVVLFLDELILWLAHNAANHSWMQNQVQSMVKLVEAQHSDRPAPVVSFIARQRNLAEMVGEELVGPEQKNLQHILQHWEGRFGTIPLEDTNLPLILQKRILRPVSDHAKGQLAQAVEKLQQTAKRDWDTLLGEQGSLESFQQVYPFSPALVKTLVELSTVLQRERTAIKMLVEILVDYAEDVSLGDLVCVGDLFDVLLSGDSPADGRARERFQLAARVYEERLLPKIHLRHGTGTPERCQRLRVDHETRLGCANCSERQCRADNRLVKTLLLAQLAPKVRELRDLTATQLTALNHGSIKTSLPNQEVKQVIARLRELSGSTGVIHVGTEGDPSVHAVLDDVSVLPMLAKAQTEVSGGAEQRVLKEALFRAMRLGEGKDANLIDHRLLGGTGIWRGSQRTGQVRFGNVRKLPDETLRPADGYDYLLVVDYPFDDLGFGPRDDEAKVERLRNNGEGAWTLVWLPSFLSAGARAILKDLVALDKIFETPEDYLTGLSVDDRERARTTLQTMQTQKRTQLNEALEQAYGLRADRPEQLDADLTIEQHLHLMQPDTPLRPAVPANLEEAADTYAAAVLETRYPRHPLLKEVPTAKRREQALELFGRLIDDDHRRLVLDKEHQKLATNILQPMQLVRLVDDALLLDEAQALRVMEAARERAGNDQPSVAQLGRWLDPEDRMGLSPELRTLYVRCYARWSARTLVRDGESVLPAPPVLAPDVELRKPNLPEHKDWNMALERAGQLMGITLRGKALHADNLSKLDAALQDFCTPARLQAVLELPKALSACLNDWSVPATGGRVRTAELARSLGEVLKDAKGGRARVEALAKLKLGEVSVGALSAHLAAAEATLPKLKRSLELGVLEGLRREAPQLLGAEQLLAQWVNVLSVEEVTDALAPKLVQLAHDAQQLIKRGKFEPDTVHEILVRVAASNEPAPAAVRRLIADLEAALKKLPDNDVLRLTGELRIERA